jgi:hypothetical protein
MKVNRRFGGTYLYLQGRRVSHARNQYEIGHKQRRNLETYYIILVKNNLASLNSEENKSVKRRP